MSFLCYSSVLRQSRAEAICKAMIPNRNKKSIMGGDKRGGADAAALLQYKGMHLKRIFLLALILLSFGAQRAEAAAAVGQQAYTTPGTYSWTAPAGVTSVSVVCVGGGSGGDGHDSDGAGGGGALAYANAITVIPGNSYSVIVGTAGATSNGGDSTFNSTSCGAGGGHAPASSVSGAGGAVLNGLGGEWGCGRLYLL